MSAPVAVVVFVLGVVLAVWATERLLDGLVGLSRAANLPTFAVGTAHATPTSNASSNEIQPLFLPGQPW